MAATQVQAAAMLQRIKAGRFDPDETRVAFVDRQIASFCAEIDNFDERLQYGDLDAVDASGVEDAVEAEAEAHESKAALRIFLPATSSRQAILSGSGPCASSAEMQVAKLLRTYLAMFDMSMQVREICSSQPAVVHCVRFNLFFFQRARGLWPVLCRF